MTGVLSEFHSPPEGVLSLPAAGVVDVWRVPLDPRAEVVAALKRLLSLEEVARAERFHFERHWRRFIVRHAALRRLLGGYLERPPEAIRFAHGKRGKPRLAAPPVGGRSLEFNLSHSRELALVAVSAGCEVGVDLEAIRPVEDAQALAERFFSAAERVALAACSEGERERAFYRCWTRKEACLKAMGDGITLRLDRFDVPLDPGDGVRLCTLAHPGRATEWSFVHIEPGPGYVGALALPIHPQTVRGWQWHP